MNVSSRVIAFFAVMPMGIAALADVQYSVQPLNLASGVSFAYPRSISDSGAVSGYAVESDGKDHPFVYLNGTMTVLSQIGDMTAVNSSGAAVGWYLSNGSSISHAFSYIGGKFTDLGTLGGTDSGAYGINSSGLITGTSDTPAGQVPFVYDTSMHALPTLGGTGNNDGRSINDLGHVAGFSSLPNGEIHAFLYDGTIHDLGALASSGTTRSEANGLNVHDAIVGFSMVSSSAFHAFEYTGGNMANLGTVGQDVTSEAFGINDAGQNVGYGDQGLHAFIDKNGTLTPLTSVIDPTLGLSIDQALSINNLGQIVGLASNGSGQSAVILTPVPEPSAAALLLAGFLLCARSRNHKPSI